MIRMTAAASSGGVVVRERMAWSSSTSSDPFVLVDAARVTSPHDGGQRSAGAGWAVAHVLGVGVLQESGRRDCRAVLGAAQAVAIGVEQVG